MHSTPIVVMLIVEGGLGVDKYDLGYLVKPDKYKVLHRQLADRLFDLGSINEIADYLCVRWYRTNQVTFAHRKRMTRVTSTIAEARRRGHLL